MVLDDLFTDFDVKITNSKNQAPNNKYKISSLIASGFWICILRFIWILRFEIWNLNSLFLEKECYCR
jgi:hypothetical protein